MQLDEATKCHAVIQTAGVSVHTVWQFGETAETMQLGSHFVYRFERKLRFAPAPIALGSSFYSNSVFWVQRHTHPLAEFLVYLLIITVRVTIKFPLDTRRTPYQYPSYTRTSRHRKYARSQSAPVFVKHQISTRQCESFGMFAERSMCYFSLSSVWVCGLLSPFQSLHSSQLVLSASQDGLFRLCKAENLIIIVARRTVQKSLAV